MCNKSDLQQTNKYYSNLKWDWGGKSKGRGSFKNRFIGSLLLPLP